MLRSRAKRVSKTVKELDAFPKVPESYVETSPVGGTCMHLAIDKFSVNVLIAIKQLQSKFNIWDIICCHVEWVP
jgi:hypothetical protein